MLVSTDVPDAPRRRLRAVVRPGTLLGVFLGSVCVGVAVSDGAARTGWAYLLVSVGAALVCWVGDRARPQHRRGRRPWIPIALTCNAVAALAWHSGLWLAGAAGGGSPAGRALGARRPG